MSELTPADFEMGLSAVSAMIAENEGLTTDGEPKVDELEKRLKDMGVNVDINAAIRNELVTAFRERIEAGKDDIEDESAPDFEEQPAPGPAVESRPAVDLDEDPFEEIDEEDEQPAPGVQAMPSAPPVHEQFGVSSAPPVAPVPDAPPVAAAPPKALDMPPGQEKVGPAPDAPVVQGEWQFLQGWWCNARLGVAVSTAVLLAHKRIPELNFLNRPHWTGQNRDSFLGRMFVEERARRDTQFFQAWGSPNVQL